MWRLGLENGSISSGGWLESIGKAAKTCRRTGETCSARMIVSFVEYRTNSNKGTCASVFQRLHQEPGARLGMDSKERGAIWTAASLSLPS